MFPKLRFLSLILLFASIVPAQTTSEKNATEDVDELRKDAVAFLRETLSDVNGLRTLENRISFTAELAGLMWFHDEREARAMYVAAIAEFRDLLARYDARMNELGTVDEDHEPAASGPTFLVFDPSERNRLLRKFSMALAVRQQMAVSIAEHEPDLALSFYHDTLSLIGNPALRQEAESKQTQMESQLLAQIVEKDAEKATKLGKKSIEKGVDFHHLELLKKIYAKDADKGAEFGQAILGTAKSGKKISTYVLAGLIEFGGDRLEASRKPGATRAVYRDSELRELAELLALQLLDMDSSLILTTDPHIALMQKYLPGRAAQIRAKFKLSRTSATANSNTARDLDFSENSGADHVTVGSNSNTHDAASERRAERDKAEKKLFEDVEGLAGKQLPKEERSKVVAEVRKIIATTPGRDKKVAALSLLAAQVAKVGDKELAAEIMRDAERLVNPAPKNMIDFALSWMLASGYASADPEKAFPLLEETIGRANDTLAAFIKVGEFIDVNEDFITDGEVQVGAFGGQMVRGFTKELGMADSTIDILAKADFDKTKNLANRFDRLEIRVLAKMMVLRSVLSPKQAPTTTADEGLPDK